MKRIFDIIISFFGIVVLMPFLLVVMALILIFDGKPIFFRQQRISIDGKEFTLLKFRTMSVKPSAEYGSFDLGCQNRVTSIGRFLRKTKLDELPQLLNVIKGDMSLVGPRPEIKQWIHVYPERWEKVHRVRSGITDPASILYRNEEDILAQSLNPEKTYREEILPHKLDIYEDYVDNHTFIGDFKIILSTIFSLFNSKMGS